MDWPQRLRAAFDGVSPPLDGDVIEELAQHASALYDAARADGCSSEDAERRVTEMIDRWRREPAALRRPPRRPPAVDPPSMRPDRRGAGIAQDVRYAFRLLRRQPRHALLTIAMLAIGIGATTALFSVTYGVLARPLPWPGADRAVILTETRGGNAARFGRVSNAAYLAWREEASTISELAAWSTRLVTLTSGGEPERIRVASATASLFSVLGVRPLIGTAFRQVDEASPVVVLSERLWRERFGGDPSMVGKVVHLDDRPHTVVAVLPDRQAFPDRDVGAIVPLAVPPATNTSLAMFEAIAALRPGATPASAATEATARGRFAVDAGMTAVAIFGSRGPIAITAQPLVEAWTAEVRRPLIVLLLAVGLLLLAATSSAAGLQLARASTRSRELAIRAALGAGTRRVARQLLVESLLLGGIGGIAGIGLAHLLHRALLVLLPVDFPRTGDIRLDAAVVVFAGVVTAGTSVAAGVLPALRLRRLDIVAALADDGAAPTGAGLRTRPARTRTLIQVVQIAIACVLLIGASLLGRSFLALVGADRGYDLSHVLSARMSMPATIYAAPERRFAMVEHVLGRLGATPGVTEAAFTSEVPLTPGGSTSSLALRSPRGEMVTAQASPRIVSSRYFAALRLRMLAGRGFSAGDTEASEPVVVVNDAFARRYLGADALGAKIPMVAYAPPDGTPAMSTVVGVVADVRYIDGRTRSQPEIYYSHRQFAGRLPVQTVTLMVRTDGPADPIAPALSAAVREADGRLVADVVMPLERRLLTTTLARPRLYAAVLGVLAGVASIIAGVGLFGLVSYAVSLRSRELAIRLAVGASRAGVVRLVVFQAVTVALWGITLGLAAAAMSARLLSTQLYGIAPYDLPTFVGVPLVLLAVATMASLSPALRAARLDPLRALRGT
jgi:putative ABC transport system permease protein